MPKANSTRISEAQRQRQFISKKFEKYAPSTVYLQVLGSGARGAPNTLYLFTDQKRYMFNCGECTQRLAHEHKVRLSRLDHIFITNKTWRNIGGLPGLSLTLQDVGVPNITLHGPEGLDELYNATRRFVIMKDMKVTMANCSPSEDFEDNVMSVKYVLISSSNENILQTDPKPVHKKPKLAESAENEFEEFLHDDTDYYRRDGLKGEGMRNHNIKPKPKPTFDKDPLKKKTEKVLYELQKQTHSCVAYICTLKKRFGTLDLEKCVELGVKPGPMLGQLKSGHDVILPDGTLVLSKTVKTPDDPGPVFIVLEVPELSYLQEAQFSQHFDNGTNPQENIPTLIVHYTPPHVFHHPTYRAFMAKFGSSVSHLVLNAQNACLGSEAVHRTQHKLHLLDADIFPLLRDVSVPATWAPAAPGPAPTPRPASPQRLRGLDELKNKIAVAQFQNIINMEGSAGDGEDLQSSDSSPKLDLIAGRTLTMFHLRPRRQLDRSVEPKLHIQDYIQETMDVDGFVGSLEQFRKLVDGLRYAKNNLQKEYPKVVFLGTGSCIPSKTRNTSAIVLQIDEHRSMILDCGEGTFGQLVRFYGPKRVNGFLRTLKAIYISHLHADHHIGLIGVLQARRNAINEMEGPSEALYLLAPGQIVSWLSVYDQQFESIRNEFTLIPNQNLLKAKLEEPTNTEMTAAVLSSIGVQNIDMCLVSHCPNAFGVAIQVDEQNKITYSGDTIPCDKLVNIGQNSTLLIHEATMEDELADEARMKMHSTTSQAIDIGRQMNAKYTVLTHFSQRYARLPRLNAHILNDNNSVGIAFDNMQITMSDLDLLPHMYAPLQLMFAEHCVELELKAAHRARQKEKRPSSPDIDTPVSTKRSHCRPDTTSSPPSHSPSHRESSITRQKPVISKTGNSKQSCRSKSSSPTKISNRKTTSPKSDKGPASSVKSKEIAPSSTTSVISDIEKVEVLMTNQTITDSYVVNTHSKTLHTTSKEIKDVSKHSSPRNIKKPVTSSVSPPRSNLSEVSGYGKAMVTPINKRLVLQRDNNRTMSAGSDRTSICFGRKQTSTTSWKENRHSSSPTPINSREASKPKLLRLSIINIVASILLLYHFMFWKLNNLVSWLSYIQLQFLITVITVGYLFWTAAREMSSANEKIRGYKKSDSKYLYVKSTVANGSLSQSITPQSTSLSPRRHSVERKCYETRNSSPNAKVKTAQMVYSQNARILNSGTPLSNNLSRNRIPVVRNGNSTKENLSPTQAVSPSRSTSRESQNGRFQKPQICRNIKPTINTPSSHAHHSSRSFKPQLEDIKSSYLLLNQREIEKNIKKQVNNVKNGLGLHSYEFGRVTDYWLDIKVKEIIKDIIVSKPPLLNENNRQSILKESMRKFRTKQFWNDSKYEKIEGLNWISWK